MESISSQSAGNAEAEPPDLQDNRVREGIRPWHNLHPDGSPARTIRELSEQNAQLRDANSEVNQHLDYRTRTWDEERSRLITRLRNQEEDLVRTTDQVGALRETLRNQRRASAADRNHLNAHQQIARYGTQRHPIYPEVLDTDSDDAQPARNRPRHV